MHWVDRIANEIVASAKYKPYWVDDMKTPSGRIHVGSLRGMVIHDLVYKGLVDLGKKATFTYVFDDSDPMDEVSAGLDREKWAKFLGQPLFTVPSPEKRTNNYAEYFANEFIEVFNKIGCQPKILWTSSLYREGKMNEGVRACLDGAGKIRKIYEDTYHKELPSDWYPFNVVCPKCGKESTTKVGGWDGEKVSFACVVDAVPWTRGCGYKGKVSPFSGNGNFVGKLPWKVEWPVKWQAIGVTVEGAGKDHMSAGGSHDIAKFVCERVLGYPVPYPIAYEFFLIGGKKMSSSKGLGTSAKEISEIIPPYLLRFLFVRMDYREAINFDPVETMLIPDLFDEYDRAWQAYIESGDETLVRTFVLSLVREGVIPGKEKTFIPRFREVAQYIQFPDVDLKQRFEKMKGEALTPEEMKILREREHYARIWIRDYAPSGYKVQMVDEVPSGVGELSDAQKKFLEGCAKLVESESGAESLQLAMYELAKKLGIESTEAFEAIYVSFLGKKYGPRAAWFLWQYPKDRVIERLLFASRVREPAVVKEEVGTIDKPDFFAIDPEVKKKFPSVSVGIAFIKGVKVTESDSGLEIEKRQLLQDFGGLTTDKIGRYAEILSYRKLYKEMGVDWHSRRPGPEELLRRVALSKGLYTINTCVDAYNLIVMKSRVSIGAFDADRVSFPALLRFAKEGDKVLLLGSKEPTVCTSRELVYYDQVGGYNLDFNYRDSQRTSVTEETKNLWINVDGVYDVTTREVNKSLTEAVGMIRKYCGGTVDFIGVVV
ncbi:MAG: lysine--tRNA ligase [Deltaproteobacteria bacterium]|nr:lysine--tRNA ligase [Deltaproteobacteria bacterium]